MKSEEGFFVGGIVLVLGFIFFVFAGVSVNSNRREEARKERLSRPHDIHVFGPQGSLSKTYENVSIKKKAVGWVKFETQEGKEGFVSGPYTYVEK